MFMNILPAIPFPSPAPTGIGDERNDAGHDGKGADLDGRRGSGSDGEDAPLNSADPAEPSTQPPSALQRSPSYQQEQDGPHEPDELQNNIDNGRTINNDRGPLSLARPWQPTTKPSRIAIPASSLPQRSAAKAVKSANIPIRCPITIRRDYRVFTVPSYALQNRKRRGSPRQQW